MILFSNDAVQDPTKKIYPNRIEVTDAESLRQAVAHDYVCAQYRNNERGKANFMVSDCLAMDCDNDHSDNPDDWKTPDDIEAVFPGVQKAIQYSRNHMREKNGKAPRPKFHILFLIDPVTDPETYAAIKRRVHEIFPQFDSNALDAARCFFGTPEPMVDWVEGTKTLTDFLAENNCAMSVAQNEICDTIPDGRRNSTLSAYAVKVLKKSGDTEKAYQCFNAESQKCSPPLGSNELENIWASARQYYNRTVKNQEGYVLPDDYTPLAKKGDVTTYKPTDYSDVGQAQVLAECNKGDLCYTPQTGFLCYVGTHWEENDLKAQSMVHVLTELQLQESEDALSVAMEKLRETGAKALIEVAAEQKAIATMNDAQKEAYQNYKKAKAFRDFAVRRRNSAQIKATLTEVRPMVAIDPALLDANPYLLCTPEATYDLRKGLEGAQPHKAEDYITKMTAVSPGDQGAELWDKQLQTVFCGDAELIEYVQQICGTALLGQVRIESIVIAYGSGRNGKSTFFNVIAKALGKYSGTISAEVLTTSCKHNARPELAELRAKRFVVAAEMREGSLLDDSILKKLASTDEINAEKKYKAPFAFVPSHTLVLYTNHLPGVCADDDGTWRRLLVIPFEAVIEGSGDIKNYAEYLFENAAPAIMAWLIEGARKAYEANYRFAMPKRVKTAMDEYREANDWFAHFLEDCCDVAPHLKVVSGGLYQAYRNYSNATGAYTRKIKDFMETLKKRGYQSTKSKGHTYYHGLAVKPLTELEYRTGVGAGKV